MVVASVAATPPVIIPPTNEPTAGINFSNDPTTIGPVIAAAGTPTTDASSVAKKPSEKGRPYVVEIPANIAMYIAVKPSVSASGIGDTPIARADDAKPATNLRD